MHPQEVFIAEIILVLEHMGFFYDASAVQKAGEQVAAVDFLPPAVNVVQFFLVNEVTQEAEYIPVFIINGCFAGNDFPVLTVFDAVSGDIVGDQSFLQDLLFIISVPVRVYMPAQVFVIFSGNVLLGHKAVVSQETVGCSDETPVRIFPEHPDNARIDERAPEQFKGDLLPVHQIADLLGIGLKPRFHFPVNVADHGKEAPVPETQGDVLFPGIAPMSYVGAEQSRQFGGSGRIHTLIKSICIEEFQVVVAVLREYQAFRIFLQKPFDTGSAGQEILPRRHIERSDGVRIQIHQRNALKQCIDLAHILVQLRHPGRPGSFGQVVEPDQDAVVFFGPGDAFCPDLVVFFVGNEIHLAFAAITRGVHQVDHTGIEDGKRLRHAEHLLRENVGHKPRAFCRFLKGCIVKQDREIITVDFRNRQGNAVQLPGGRDGLAFLMRHERNGAEQIDLPDVVIVLAFTWLLDLDEAFLHMPHGIFIRHRFAEIVALYLFTAGVAQKAELFLRLHSFRQRLDLDFLGHLDHGGQNLPGTLVKGAQEVHVDLQLIEPVILERIQGRITASEIIHPDLEAGPVKFRNHLAHQLLLLSHEAFGDLNIDQVSGNLIKADGIVHFPENVA